MANSPHFSIGTRGSDLAMWQAHHVRDLILAHGGTCDITVLSTQGDREQVQAFEKLEGKGFFTKEIEQALLEDRIDLAVHSHKDLETRQPDGLCIAAVPARAAAEDILLIHPRAGSYYFLAELIIDLELPADEPIRDHCGTCRRCIDACPTEAIAESGYLLDASKCISYLTIELREAIPEEFRGKMQNWMFGCDVCQEVCPWNRFSRPHDEPAFFPKEELLEMKKSDWLELTEEVFKGLFRRSAVKRTGYSGLKRNLDFLYGNQ